MTPRDYKLHLTFIQKTQLALPAIMFTVAPIFLYFAFRSFDEDQFHSPYQGPPEFFPFLFWVFAAIYWWEILTLLHTIGVTAQGQIEFVSLLRRRQVATGDIVSIGPGKRGFFTSVMGGFSLKHRSGKIGFVNQFTGMHELLTEVRKVNPAVELIGC